MTTWLTKNKAQQADLLNRHVTLNVAFFRDIKQDHRSLSEQIAELRKSCRERSIRIRELAQRLVELQDELKTYFALEEFYGYFNHAAVTHPVISKSAASLRNEHETLFLELAELIEWSERVVYREPVAEISLEDLFDRYLQFADRLQSHEQREMDLMMRLCNEEFGVGD